MIKPVQKTFSAFPSGTHWTPVDQALEHLRVSLEPILIFNMVNVRDSLVLVNGFSDEIISTL